MLHYRDAAAELQPAADEGASSGSCPRLRWLGLTICQRNHGSARALGGAGVAGSWDGARARWLRRACRNGRPRPQSRSTWSGRGHCRVRCVEASSPSEALGRFPSPGQKGAVATASSVAAAGAHPSNFGYSPSWQLLVRAVRGHLDVRTVLAGTTAPSYARARSSRLALSVLPESSSSVPSSRDRWVWRRRHLGLRLGRCGRPSLPACLPRFRHGALLWDNYGTPATIRSPRTVSSTTCRRPCSGTCRSCLGCGSVHAALRLDSRDGSGALSRLAQPCVCGLRAAPSFTGLYSYSVAVATTLGGLACSSSKRTALAIVLAVATLGFSPLAFAFLCLILVSHPIAAPFGG